MRSRRQGTQKLSPVLAHLGRDLATASAARLAFKRMARDAFRSVKPPLHRLVAQGVAGSPA